MAGPFAGAMLLLRPRSSKRKIFGLYENVLNEWISERMKGKSWVLDIGANDGYDTYGFAHVMKRAGVPEPRVIAYEPQLDTLPELRSPSEWDSYSGCDFVFEDKFISAHIDDQHTTLDQVAKDYGNKLQGNGLVKIDIEGAECDALSGASSLLKDDNVDWLIEIHGRERIPTVASYFSARDRPFVIKELKPLPFLGKEQRTIETFWLVTL